MRVVMVQARRRRRGGYDRLATQRAEHLRERIDLALLHLMPVSMLLAIRILMQIRRTRPRIDPRPTRRLIDRPQRRLALHLPRPRGPRRRRLTKDIAVRFRMQLTRQFIELPWYTVHHYNRRVRHI